MKIKYLFLFLLIISCTSKPRKKNALEIELDKITEGQLKNDLEKVNFVNFTIDWEHPNKWESDCEYDRIIPKQDTFKNIYYADFCYDKYRWWDRN